MGIIHKKENSNTMDFIVFCVLFLSGSFLTSNDIIPPFASKVLWITIILFLLYQLIKQKKQLTLHWTLITLALGFLISGIVNHDSISTIFFCLISIVIAEIVISCWTFSEFRDSYVRVITFLCCVSLIMMTLFFLFPSIMNSLFVVRNANDTAYHCNFVIFTKLRGESGFGRNCGMFWEPGAFQTFICIALMFETIKDEPNRKRILLFIITIITTFSTTGYFSLALIILHMLLKRDKTKKSYKPMIISFVVLFIVFVLLNQDLFFSLDKYTTFGKLLLYAKSSSYHNTVSSVSIRINSVFQPILIFFKHPLFGVGNNDFRSAMYDMTYGVTTCTLFNWFAIYGIIVGSTMTIAMVKVSQILTSGFLCRVLFFSALFLTTASENYVTNVAIIIILLYSFSKEKGSSLHPEHFNKNDLVSSDKGN